MAGVLNVLPAHGRTGLTDESVRAVHVALKQNLDVCLIGLSTSLLCASESGDLKGHRSGRLVCEKQPGPHDYIKWPD